MEELLEKVRKIINDDFIVDDIDYIPRIDDEALILGNRGLRFDTTVLHIDLRGSTKILNSHNKTTVAKIHMAYYYVIVKIANALNGEVRSFNGDSLLVFFHGEQQETISQAVGSAMIMRLMLGGEEGIQPIIRRRYNRTIDFGIGIDSGQILCTKVGIGGDSHNKDLFWIGNAVNKATRLSDRARLPNAVWISKRVLDKLPENMKYRKHNIWDIVHYKTNIWEESYDFKYNSSIEPCYYTDSFISIDE